eukprot:9836034-Karenia_brevis.AAC.1
MKRNGGLGLDFWSNRALLHLPDAALDALGLEMYNWQINVMWPRQLLYQLVLLLQKPAGGDRPITLLAMVVRLLTRLWMPMVKSWARHQQLPWDTAKEGSSALQAAFDRASRDEIAYWEGRQACSILWDLKKFYDSIDIFKMMEHASAMRYPMVPLVMAVELYLAVRTIQFQRHASNWIHPTRSMCAGCGQATFLV